MARMDLKLRRDAPGMSVFWMILIVGAAVFVLLAIVLMSADGSSEVEPEGAEIVAGEGDEVPGTTSFSEGEAAEPQATPTEGVAGEAAEVDEAVPESGQADDTEEAGTAGAVDADPAAEVEPQESEGVATGDEQAQEPAGADEPAAEEAATGDEAATEQEQPADGGATEAEQPVEEEPQE